MAFDPTSAELYEESGFDPSSAELVEEVKATSIPSAGAGRGRVNPAMASDEQGQLIQASENGTEVEKANAVGRWLNNEVQRLRKINPGASIERLANMAYSRYQEAKKPQAPSADRAGQYASSATPEQYTSAEQGTQAALQNAAFDVKVEQKFNPRRTPDENGESVFVPYNPNTAKQKALAEEQDRLAATKRMNVRNAVTPEFTAGGAAQDIAAGTAKVLPTALKGVADVASMLSGGEVGRDTSNKIESFMSDVDKYIASDRAGVQKSKFEQDMADNSVSISDAILNNKGALADQIIPQLGSMFIPMAAANVAGKAATFGKYAQALSEAEKLARVGKAQEAAVIVSTVLQNSADSFNSVLKQGGSLADAYLAAGMSAPFSAIAGKITGGGAEMALAKRLFNGRQAATGVLKATAKEGGQETIEQFGQSLGEATGMGQELDPTKVGKELAVAGILGAAMGGGVDVSIAAVDTALPKATTPEQSRLLADRGDQLSRIQNVETIQAIGNAPDMDSAIAAATKTLDSTSEAMKAVENIERIFDNASTATTPLPASDTGAIGGGLVNAPSSVDSGVGVDSAGGSTVDAGGLESQPASVGVLPETQPNLALNEEIARLRQAKEAAPIEAGANGESQPTAVEGLPRTGGTDLQADGIASEVDQRLTPISKRADTQIAAPVEPIEQQATEVVAPSVEVSAKTEPTQVETLGRNGVPISEGGKPFKTQAAAKEARKLQPAMRVISTEGGYVLAPKTEKQLAAEAKAAKRLGVPKTSAAGEPIPAHSFIASEGGLSKLAQSDLGVDGNPRIGNRNLFGKAGMTIEQATEKLKAEGYLPQGAGNNEALALIKRSLTNPQYTPEGVERMAAKEQAAAFEDYLAAEEESALSDDFDPFVSVAELGYELEQAENAGYDEASDAIKQEVNAALALAESQGIDIDEIKYNAADETYNQSEQAYYEAAKRILEKALAGSDGDSNQDASGEVETLVAPSREEVIEKQDREAEAVRSEKEQQKAKDLAAKKEQERKEIAKASEAAAETYTLGGDAMENLTGQKPMFSRRATETLDAAGVTGKERVDAMIAINRGDITPEQLEAAYPAKNPQTETEAFKKWFGDSKVVDANGNPLVVYHGTNGDFTVFDYSKIGQQGRAEGAGFYFTNNKDVASGYGKVIDAFLSIQKPLPYDAKPFPKSTIEKIVKRIAELESKAEGNEIADGFLSNFGDVNYDGLNAVVKQAANLIANENTAVDQLSGIVGSGVNSEFVNQATTDVTGYDGIVANGFSNSGDTDNKIYVAFFRNQIKSASKNSGEFSKTNPDIFKSQAPKPKTTTPVSQIRAAITKAYGNLLSQLEKRGVTTITQTQEEAITAAAQARADKNGGDVAEIKKSLMQLAGMDVKRSSNGDIQGFFDPESGKSFLIADNLTSETAPAVLMHEVGIHAANDGSLDGVFKRASNILKAGKGNAWIDAVNRRMKDAGETSGEEAAAYITEAYEADRTNAPKSIVQFLKDFAAAIRAWAFKRGIIIKADDLSIADIAAIARANARNLAGVEATGDMKASIAKYTNSAAFKRWFDGSKIVNDDGSPLVVYHGTTADIDSFDAAKSGQKDAGFYGDGFYFSADSVTASTYSIYGDIRAGAFKPITGNENQDLTGANVLPVFVSIKNPYIWPEGRDESTSRRESVAIRKELEAQGYDGIIVPNKYAEEGVKSKFYEVIAFRPEQIKSATGNNGDYSPTNPDIRKSAPLTNLRGLDAFSKVDDLFALPKSTSKDLEQIARDNGVEVKVRTTSFGNEKLHTLTFPNGTEIRISDRKASPYGQDQQVYAFDLVDGTAVPTQIGRPGENPEDVPPTDDVWLDVSKNTPGEYGAKAYNIAATYAHNNGKIFVGDPSGLSDEALRRRTEQMLSSALKFGTTEHLAPHPRQVEGDAKLGVPPLKWIYGDDIGNIERMIDVSLQGLESAAPGAKNDTIYDQATGEFTDKSGKVVTRKSTMGRDMAAYRAGVNEAQAGWRTLARAAFLRSFLGPNGKAEGSGILDRASGDVARLASGKAGEGNYPATERIFYSRKDDFDAGTIEVKNKKSPVAWKDVTGRWQFAPGQSLYNMLGDAATPLLNKLGLKAASPELRKLMRQMSIDVEKATETATAIAGEAKKLSEAERLMVSDIVEKEVQAGTIPPEHAIRLAAVINQVMTKQTDELVSLGMLSKESSDRLRDKYLPRFYESKLKDKVGDVWADSIGRMFMPTSAMKGIKGKHLKGRGLYETIPESQVSAYEALGWEVRDPDYNPSVPSVDGKVQMWRDFTRQERDKMGEIRDVSFRMVMGYMQTQKDIALGRMFQAIASDPEMSSRFETEKLSVKVPDSKIEGTGANTYGKLAGRWVSPETFSQLSKTGEAQNEALQFYRKAMGKWKEAKTVLNPVSHANNIISNVTMAHLAGVSYWRPDTYIGAIRDLVKNGKEIAEAKEAGLFLGSMSHEELMQNMPDELKEIAGKQASTTEKVGKTVWDLMTFWLSKPMGAAYQAEDSFFRYLIYKDARSRGTSPEDAVDYAQKYIFTYDDLPSGARKIRDYGIPFFAYTYKAIPALLHTAMVHPVRMAAPASVLWAINAAAYAIAAGDEDDDWKLKLKKYLTDEEYRNKVKEKEKLERDLLPEWNKGTTSLMTPKVIRLGNDELTNLPLFLDMSRMIPGGDLFDVNPNAGGIPLPQPITPSHPLFSLAVGLLANKDTFLGKDLTDSNDTSAEKTAKRANWIWKQLSPAIAVNNYHWERTMNALAQANGGEVKYVPDLIGGESTGIGRDGLPVQPKYAAMQTFGIKVRPMDLEAAESIQIGMKKKLINDIDVELRKIKRLYNKGAIPERVMEAEREKAQLKKQRIREGLTIEGDVKD